MPVTRTRLRERKGEYRQGRRSRKGQLRHVPDLTAIHRGRGTLERKKAIYAAIVARTKSPSLHPNPDDINDYYQNTATPDERAAMRAELKTQLKLLKGP
jgi:hypothetical protein